MGSLRALVNAGTAGAAFAPMDLSARVAWQRTRGEESDKRFATGRTDLRERVGSSAARFSVGIRERGNEGVDGGNGTWAEAANCAKEVGAFAARRCLEARQVKHEWPAAINGRVCRQSRFRNASLLGSWRWSLLHFLQN